MVKLLIHVANLWHSIHSVKIRAQPSCKKSRVENGLNDQIHSEITILNA